MSPRVGLEVCDIRAGYSGQRQVLDGVSLSVARGEVGVVLGPSGVGKTTLLRVIAGLHQPTAGTVWIGDKIVDDATVHVPTKDRRVGLVPQEAALFSHLSVGENVAFGISGEPDARARAEALLTDVGLEGFYDRRPDELSGGQQQRAAIARAIAPNPEILLLDEPFIGLDPEASELCRNVLRDLLGKHRTTALMVTHEQQAALALADVIVVLRDGKVSGWGAPEALYEHPRNVGTAESTGEAVTLQATISGAGQARCALGEVQVLGQTRNELPTGTTGVILWRPEELSIKKTNLDDLSAGTGVVKDVEFFGHDSLVQVAPIGGDLPVWVRVLGRPPARDERVKITPVKAGRFYPETVRL